jgi:hypothetical protein
VWPEQSLIYLETVMKARIVYSAAVGACVTLMALSAGGQTTTGNTSNATTTAGAAASAAGKSVVTPSSSTQKHHATTHHQSNAKHKHIASASPASNHETAYDAALKQCVAGPAGQRENCLDGAIARFGRA